MAGLKELRDCPDLLDVDPGKILHNNMKMSFIIEKEEISYSFLRSSSSCKSFKTLDYIISIIFLFQISLFALLPGMACSAGLELLRALKSFYNVQVASQDSTLAVRNYNNFTE